MSSNMIVTLLIGWMINSVFVSGIDFQIQVNENPKINESRQKALEWLFSVQDSNGSWGSETHRILTSIILSDETFRNEKHLKYYKAFEELKTKLSFALSERITSISAGQLALYANALMTNCYDPQNFNGVNIISKMIEKKKISSYEIGLVSLSACLAKKEHDVILMGTDFLQKLNPLFVDARAMIVMALICIRDKYKENKMNKYIQEQLELLKGLQTSKGNFGNIYSSALVIQALTAAKEKDGWSYEKGINYVLSEQKHDGSFGDLLATYFVLPVLNGRSFVDIGNVGCEKLKVTDYSKNPINQKVELITENSTGPLIPHLTEYNLKQISQFHKNLINVVFSIWSERSGKKSCFTFRSKKFTVPENSSFLEVMKVAQKEDKRYSFKAKKYSWGSFIEEIDGIHNDNDNHYYWMLYKINETGDLVLTSEGADKERPKNNDHYIFKYCLGICSLC
ncbi:uncharacterized protein CG3556-like [Centruroides sculpturatus]|uniref:uncharacterized protein CG3556-like n=1 Tax=Centruroides sculpturatus TaxID=218467 RepID=UPI000C6E12C7|nr:uncharacterized protein CG3556-like [Centruroides sculpturatus]